MKSRLVIIVTAFLTLPSIFNVNAQEKKPADSTADFDYKKPVFKFDADEQANENGLLRYSFISGYREGIKPINTMPYMVYKDEKQGTIRFSMYNLSIVDMLNQNRYKPNQIILEVKDPSKYWYDPKNGGTEEEWLRKNGHCYELMLPLGTTKDNTVDNDLAAVLNVKFGPQKRIMDVLVLTRTSEKDKIKSKGKQESSKDMEVNGSFNNVPLDRLVSSLSTTGLPIVVDQTGYKDNVDLKLKVNSWNNIDLIRKELNKYDLDLKPEKREVTMLVITENK